MKKKRYLKATPTSAVATLGTKRKDGYVNTIAPKSVSRVRADIATWNAALRAAMSAENPKRVRLYNLYNEVMLDALLTSQIENRKQATLGAAFTIQDANGTVNEEATGMLNSAAWQYAITQHILETSYYGHSVVELLNTDTGIVATLIPRNNIKPELGLFVADETNESGIDYRNAKEYGVWILEFGQANNYGLLNKAIPHVLFKRFAQSCWSELCEIYGIPPRVMHTNTQDPAMLNRAENMMRDMGAAAWFIIDETEKFEFATGATTNGDVYKNLINLCNNENSLLISGAVIGQDTQNGSNAKETQSVKLLEKLIEADRRMVEGYWNTIVLPALYKIGILPEGLVLQYLPEENIPALFEMVVKLMPHKEVDSTYITDKFGIPVTDKAVVSGSADKEPTADPKKLHAKSFFCEG